LIQSTYVPPANISSADNLVDEQIVGVASEDYTQTDASAIVLQDSIRGKVLAALRALR
jgi:hypothetical protein